MNNLNLEKSKKIIFQKLNQFKEERSKVYMWSLSGERRVMTEVDLVLISKYKSELRFFKSEPDEIVRDIIDTSNGIINFYIPDHQLLFQAPLKECKDFQAILVGFPRAVAQVERRKDLRLVVNSKALAIVKFFKSNISNGDRVHTQQFERQCYDISAGGLSFIIPKSEKKFFCSGDLISSMNILFNGKDLETDAKIINIINIDPDEKNGVMYKGVKICVQYMSIASDDKVTLAKEVFKHCELDL